MHRLKLYCTLGHTRNTRRQRMRDNILRNGEQLHKRGLDSRIPFLKFAYLPWQDSPNGSTARRKEAFPIPEWRGGEVLIYFQPEEVQRFNIFNVSNGLQALYAVHPNIGSPVIKVISCHTTWRGDLRITYLPENNGLRVQNGVYNRFLNQIVFAPNCLHSANALIHEVEHAGHTNLYGMSTSIRHFSSRAEPISVRTQEYLAMLAETMHTCEIPMVNIVLKRWPKLLRREGTLPHIFASFCFVANLVFRYRMTPEDIRKAVRAAEEDQIDDKHLKQIRDCAEAEYERTYEKIFGLTLEDICEVIDSVPIV